MLTRHAAFALAGAGDSFASHPSDTGVSRQGALSPSACRASIEPLTSIIAACRFSNATVGHAISSTRLISPAGISYIDRNRSSINQTCREAAPTPTPRRNALLTIYFCSRHYALPFAPFQRTSRPLYYIEGERHFSKLSRHQSSTKPGIIYQYKADEADIRYRRKASWVFGLKTHHRRSLLDHTKTAQTSFGNKAGRQITSGLATRSPSALGFIAVRPARGQHQMPMVAASSSRDGSQSGNRRRRLTGASATSHQKRRVLRPVMIIDAAPSRWRSIAQASRRPSTWDGN